MLNSKSKYGCKPKDKIDTIDLEIIQCLSRDCRASYRDISSVVGITPNAIKGRINKMVCNYFLLFDRFGTLFIIILKHLHQLPLAGRAGEPMLESWSTLSLLAGITSKIRLGTLINYAHRFIIYLSIIINYISINYM